MNASEADELISIVTPLIRTLASEVGVKVVQLVQFPHSTVGVVGISSDRGRTDGIDKEIISGKACSTASFLSNRFQ